MVRRGSGVRVPSSAFDAQATARRWGNRSAATCAFRRELGSAWFLTQQPSYARYEVGDALLYREAVAVELERTRVFRCLRRLSPQLPRSRLILPGTRLLL